MISTNLVRTVLAEGGTIKPLLISSLDSNGLGLCNPSVFIDGGEIWLILRNVNYTLYHCENEQLFNNRWGCLSYLNPEHDLHLRTTNFLCKLKLNLEIEDYWKIDTSELDQEPLWEFVGLEDARLVRWEGRLFGIGVRRDTTKNGVGRMEMSELKLADGKVKEVARYRIEHPTNPDWYCEKNWMPVLDLPYHFVKWSNPVELVKADIRPGMQSVSTVKSRRALEVDESDKREGFPFLRGSSQVISWRGYYVCIVHDCDLFKNRSGQKDATYMHRFVVYDRDWKIVKIGDPYSFLGGEIEFCCGLAEWERDLLITFGFQDNCAFVLRVPEHMIAKLLDVEVKQEKWRATQYPTLEVTTSIPANGCPLVCAYCPQDELKAAYDDDRFLSLENFDRVLGKLPKEIQITFAGYVEPFVNKDCAAMIRLAHAVGHKVSLFTTGVGMTVDDFEQIRGIPYTGVQGGFVVHLPDAEGYFSHSLLPGYMELLARMKQKPPLNFRTVTMGTLPKPLQELFPGTIRQTMYSRAGNVKRNDVVQITTKQAETTCGCPERLYHNVLLPNGDVSLCCMDYSLRHILGNLFEQDYEDVIPVDGAPFALCKNCENGVPAARSVLSPVEIHD